MDDLIAFLRARLDERERAANAMKAVYPTPWEVADRGWMARIVADEPYFHEVIRLDQQQAPDAGYLTDAIEHVLLHDPDRMLADVAAKQKIIDERALADPDEWGRGYGDAIDRVLKLLALPYSDHPDYNESWRP